MISLIVSCRTRRGIIFSCVNNSFPIAVWGCPSGINHDHIKAGSIARVGEWNVDNEGELYDQKHDCSHANSIWMMKASNMNKNIMVKM